MKITPVESGDVRLPELGAVRGPGGSGAGEAASGPAESFAAVFKEAAGAEKASTQAAERFAAGDPTLGIHEVMIAAEKANIAVRFAVTLKNKAIEAYRELMNTQL